MDWWSIKVEACDCLVDFAVIVEEQLLMLARRLDATEEVTYILIKPDLLKVYSLTPLAIVKDVVRANIKATRDDFWSGL